MLVSLHRPARRGHGCAQKSFCQRPRLLVDVGMAAPTEANCVGGVGSDPDIDELLGPLGPPVALPGGRPSLGVAPSLAVGDFGAELMLHVSPLQADSQVVGTGQEQEQLPHSDGLFAEASSHGHSDGDAESQSQEARPVPSPRLPPRQQPQEHGNARHTRQPRSRAKHKRRKQRRPECDREEQEDKVHDAEEREKSVVIERTWHGRGDTAVELGGAAGKGRGGTKEGCAGSNSSRKIFISPLIGRRRINSRRKFFLRRHCN